MVTLRAFQSLDTLSVGTQLRTSGTEGENTYFLSDGVNTMKFSGDYLTYNRYWPANGTVTQVEIDKGGAKVATIEGANFEFSYNNVYATAFNDSQTVYPIALSGNDKIYGSAFDDKLGGFDGDDIIFGGDGNDVLSGGAGNDILIGGNGRNVLDGGSGLNKAVYSGLRSDFTLTKADASFTIASTSGAIQDQVTNVGRFNFSDGSLAFDENAAQAYRLYQAAFHRTPDRDGVTYWVNRLDTDAKLFDVASYFIASPEFNTTYGGTTNSQFVQILYQNILERGSDPSGYEYWVGRLDHGTSRAEVLANFSESPENISHTSAGIVGGVWLNPDPQIV